MLKIGVHGTVRHASPVLGMAALLIVLAAPAARACECAFCPSDPSAAADALADYNEKMHGLALHGAKLAAGIEAERTDRLEEKVHRLVRQWLELHSAYYSKPPVMDVDPERWQEQMTGVNALVGRVFREAREGDVDAVRDRLLRLRERWLQLDRLAGIPEGYARLRQLRGDYRAFVESEEDSERAVRWAALRDRLEEAAPAWERIASRESPELFEEGDPTEGVAERLERILQASADERGKLIREEADRLDRRLEAVDARIGDRLTPDEGDDPSQARADEGG